ncbi:MAG TPA: DNA mismatch repair protein MutS [Flavobacteriales bacterium]|nr:DNA mismatch repair protein MutS [Flavobacteriales bacterium]
MKQYYQIKAQHPDALLLFRVGDFYETFGDDAKRAARVLGIVLTKRANGAAAYVELAGFPHHSLDTYLPKLVRAGMRVAICDQLEDPKATKKIVRRGVTELVTPGVAYNDLVLEQGSNNFLASIYMGKSSHGIAFLDISTGEFMVAEGSKEYLEKLLQGLDPNEVLYQKDKRIRFGELFGDKFNKFALEDWAYTEDFANDLLLKHFGTSSLKGFGITDLAHGIIAAGACLHYLNETKHEHVQHISRIVRLQESDYVWMDKFTIRNLELFASPHEDAVTLLSVLDDTNSPMGSRLLKRWLALPLKDKKAIDSRLDVVEHFINNEVLTSELRLNIEVIGDLERLISKVAVNRILPREVVQLKKALTAIEPIKSAADKARHKGLNDLSSKLEPCGAIIEKIQNEIQEDPPALLHKGNVIAEGVSKELDDLRKIAFSGKDYLVKIQEREIESTGITSLKISFNNVFGYYIEVTNRHKEKVPESWIRKQTLVNAERYITEELKEYENKILGAEEKIQTLEIKLYEELVHSLQKHIMTIQQNAAVIAKLDCLCSFASIAQKNRYVKPELSKENVLDIKLGRHPVIEQELPLGDEYIANDVYLDSKEQQIIIITGPNMSGKSALLRQTALIVLMAQMGSYVPARSATIGLVDKIFTRVGASDNISSGESTFMVEMNETASIINNLSDRSLVILDEIGRGTSTYDGISIAWAITEYIHEHPTTRARTLFATHYHEMNELTKVLPRVKNYNVSVKEANKKIIFLRKLIPGGSEHSFGIHVAKMAGIPQIVLLRANEIMAQLEKSHVDFTGTGKALANRSSNKQGDMQLNFFELNDPVLEEVKDKITLLDLNTLTPIEAMMKLAELKKLLDHD